MKLREQRRRSGAAVVELAILLPLLVFLLVIAVDFARLYHPYITITNCARNAALYGSESPTRYSDTDAIKAAAVADGATLNPPLSADDVSIRRFDDDDGQPHIEVTVTWRFETITSFPGVPSEMNITRTVQMRVAPAVPDGDS